MISIGVLLVAVVLGREHKVAVDIDLTIVVVVHTKFNIGRISMRRRRRMRLKGLELQQGVFHEPKQSYIVVTIVFVVFERLPFGCGSGRISNVLETVGGSLEGCRIQGQGKQQRAFR